MKESGYSRFWRWDKLAFISFVFFVFSLWAICFTSTEVSASATTSKSVIAKSTKYETEVYTIKSDKVGPTVMVVGGVHGNEPSGYITANKIKNWDIKKGTLIVIPKANQPAINAKKRTAKGETDLNRAFPQTKSAQAKNQVAKEIYNIAKENDIDWLIDLHEGYDYAIRKSTDSVGQSIIYQPGTETKNMADDIKKTLNGTIQAKNKKFVILKYPVKGSLARSTGDNLNANAMIIETCMKSTMGIRNRYHETAVNTVLTNLKMK